MIHIIILSIFIFNLADAASEVVTPAANIEWDKEWTFSGELTDNLRWDTGSGCKLNKDSFPLKVHCTLKFIAGVPNLDDLHFSLIFGAELDAKDWQEMVYDPDLILYYALQTPDVVYDSLFTGRQVLADKERIPSGEDTYVSVEIDLGVGLDDGLCFTDFPIFLVPTVEAQVLALIQTAMIRSGTDFCLMAHKVFDEQSGEVRLDFFMRLMALDEGRVFLNNEIPDELPRGAYKAACSDPVFSFDWLPGVEPSVDDYKDCFKKVRKWLSGWDDPWEFQFPLGPELVKIIQGITAEDVKEFMTEGGQFVFNFGKAIADGVAEELEKNVTSANITSFGDLQWDRTYYFSKLLANISHAGSGVSANVAVLNTSRCSVGYTNFPVASHCRFDIGAVIDVEEVPIHPTLREYNDWLDKIASSNSGGLRMSVEVGAEFVEQNWRDLAANPDFYIYFAVVSPEITWGDGANEVSLVRSKRFPENEGDFYVTYFNTSIIGVDFPLEVDTICGAEFSERFDDTAVKAVVNALHMSGSDTCVTIIVDINNATGQIAFDYRVETVMLDFEEVVWDDFDSFTKNAWTHLQTFFDFSWFDKLDDTADQVFTQLRETLFPGSTDKITTQFTLSEATNDAFVTDEDGNDVTEQFSGENRMSASLIIPFEDELNKELDSLMASTNGPGAFWFIMFMIFCIPATYIVGDRLVNGKPQASTIEKPTFKDVEVKAVQDSGEPQLTKVLPRKLPPPPRRGLPPAKPPTKIGEGAVAKPPPPPRTEMKKQSS